LDLLKIPKIKDIFERSLKENMEEGDTGLPPYNIKM
jgi:hypothetical protein